MVGVSDIIGFTKSGRFLAVEVKKPGGVISSDQISFLESVNKSGGIGICVDGIDSLLSELSVLGIVSINGYMGDSC